MIARSIHISLDFIIFLCFVGVLVGIFRSSAVLSRSFVIHRLFHSWKQKPFSELMFSNQSCESINMTSLLNFTWPGTVPGCYCNRTENSLIRMKDQGIQRQPCSKNKTILGCEDINPISKKTLSLWKNKSLCGKTFRPSRNLFQYKKVNFTDDCPKAFKKCGLLDTLNHVLCVRETHSCPVTEAFITNATTTLSSRILSSIRVDEDYPCFHHGDLQISEKNYPLVANSYGDKGCKSIYADREKDDTSFVKLDSYDKSLFYQENNISPLLATLPQFSSYLSNLNMSFYSGIFIGWKKECEIPHITILEQQINKVLNKLNYSINSIVIAVVIFLLSYYVGVVIIKYKKLIDETYLIGRHNIVKLASIYGVILFINMFIAIVSHSNVEAIEESKHTNSFFELIVTKNCSDTLTNTMLKDFAEESYFADLSRYNQLKFFSGGAMFICLLMSLYMFVSKLAAEPKYRYVTNEEIQRMKDHKE